MKKIKRLWLMGVLVFSLAAVFGIAAAQAVELPQDIMVVGSNYGVTTWDPSAAFSTEAVYMPNIYEGLTRTTLPGAEEKVEPLLATDWEFSPDGLSWTFYLREGVKFHDGDVFNAQAVKTSIERTMNMGAGAAFIFSAVDEITVINEYTVKFDLSAGVPLDRILGSANGAWIMSPTSAAQPREWFEEGNAVGTGPYKLASWKPDEEIILTKFEDYWGGWEGPHLEKIVIRRVNDAVVLQNMLESGTADLVTRIPVDNVTRVDATADCDVLVFPSFYSYCLHLNTQRAPLDNKLVRQAISYAIPYQDIITVAVSDLGKQSLGPIPYGEFGYDESLEGMRYTYDLDKARELMAEAGYPDGIDRTLVYTYCAENVTEEAFSPLVKEGLANIGIDVEVQSITWSSQWAKSKGDAAQRQDMFALLWWPTFNDPYDTLYSLWHSEDAPFFNLSYYSNSAVDSLMDTAYRTPDPVAALALWSAVQKILIEEAPSVYLLDTDHAVPIRTDVKGYIDNPAYAGAMWFYYMHK